MVELVAGPAGGLTAPGTTTADVVWVRVQPGPDGSPQPVHHAGQLVYLRPGEYVQDMNPDWIAYTRRRDGTWRYRPWPRPPAQHPRRDIRQT
ncbi:hypothetical protein Kisp02_54260 [Kineosporia sp. NBRC 101731]|nr:hypothetical protein Kisp02_54260 [Kineosporia sp. NBRC 101731]